MFQVLLETLQCIHMKISKVITQYIQYIMIYAQALVKTENNIMQFIAKRLSEVSDVKCCLGYVHANGRCSK